MSQMVSDQTELSTSTPKWKRITAFFTLGSIAILTGIAIAGILSIIGILLLFGLESGG